MKRWQRVKNTIQGLPVDRVPLGELVVDPAFCLKTMGRETFSFQVAQDFWDRFHLDLVVLPSRDQDELRLETRAGENEACSITRWSQETDCFIFALIDGGFSRALSAMGFQAFMEKTIREPVSVKDAINDFFLDSLEQVKDCARAGAHGIMIGDDIAYQKGTYISPVSLREHYFPFLTEFVNRAKDELAVVFFHSDGNLDAVMDDLLETGIDGLQSLEPAAGMDIENIKQVYGQNVCLMGNMDLSYLQSGTADNDVREMVSRIMKAGKPGGRFIFGTCSGLHKHLSVEKVDLMYQVALEQGVY